MNKKKNKKASEMLPLNNPTLSEAQCGEQRGDSLASACDEGADFDDLQPLFDAQSRRLDDLLRRPEARPASLNTNHSRTFRTRMFYAWGILAIYCVAAAIYWGISLWHYQYDIYFRIYTLFLEGCFLFLAVDTVSTTLAILRHDPASTPFDRMLHYARRCGMRPLYMPQKKSRLAAYIATLRSRRPSPRTLSYAFNPQSVIDNLKRTATIGIAASFTLILVSCAPTVGDGHTLTQNHPARIEAVESVTNIVNNL